jgi:hypothetical protein
VYLIEEMFVLILSNKGLFINPNNVLSDMTSHRNATSHVYETSYRDGTSHRDGTPHRDGTSHRHCEALRDDAHAISTR